MTKDYVKYKKRRHGQKSRSFWGLGLLIFCFLVVGVAWYAHQQLHFSLSSLKDSAVTKFLTYFSKKDHAVKVHSTRKKLASQTENMIKPIHFDFYDALPQPLSKYTNNQPIANSWGSLKTQEMNNNPQPQGPKNKIKDMEIEQRIEQDLAQNLSAIQASNGSSSYILQMGIFHQADAARRYRGALVSAGLKVDLVKLRIGKDIVYRLQQGPYLSLDQLQRAKKRFTERGIACEVRKLSPYIPVANHF